MVEVVIKDLDQEAALLMAKHMRPMDRLEYSAMSNGATLQMGMLHMLKVSEVAKAAFVDGELLCCWGRIKKTLLSAECCPWMVATPLIEEKRAKRVFLKQSPAIIADLTEGFQRSWNMVYDQNKTTIRWLKWAGFEFSGNDVVVNGKRFLSFEKRNAENVL